MTVGFGDLKAGDRARVLGFEKGGIAHRQKLLSLGLTPGVEFTVVRFAPLGDPVEIRVRDTFLSMRRNEASALLIERMSGEAETGDAQNRAFKFAIIGNPNTGKSTLFNTVTGVQQRVGNWPGVTVEKKVGVFDLAGQKVELVDLPGIYSLDSYEEAAAVDERIAQEYILSGEADCVINIVDAGHLERNLYLTTQLLEMRVPLVVVLNVMEDAEAHARFDVDEIARLLGCPVVALVATRKRDAELLKAELLRLIETRPEASFTITYPPPVEMAISELSKSMSEIPHARHFDNRWLAIRLLESDAFAAHAADPAIKEAAEERVRQIALELDEPDIVIANARYSFIRIVAAKAATKHVKAEGRSTTAIDRIVLNRALGVPIFLAVMYCLFWLTIQFSRAFKPFFNQVSDTLFVEGFRHVLTMLDAPSWFVALLADGLGNGVLQVINFIPIIGFLYLFLSVLEESGYMARANFVMDRLMQSLGLPGNAFVPMMVGFGCNVPAIMATRTLERPRDRIVAVLMSPFMSCGGRLAVYTVFAAAFFPETGHFVIFSVYLLGVVFAMISALIMKNSLLPQERSLFALELPPYHLPKLRNVLINAWIRVKVFVFRVGKFIIPLVLIVKVLGVWGTDGSFDKKPIDQSVLAAGGRAITPILAPMGVAQDQWPAAVALLTGVLHKVVIVSTLESIYLEAKPTAPAQAFDPVERIKRAALTIPENLKALFGLGRGDKAHSTADKLVGAAETRERARGHATRSDLIPALAEHFEGRVSALAYLILLLCYPCIATTAATARETNQRWTGFMVFWTISLGYGMAVLFYQIGTFAAHPFSSTAWVLGILLYFSLLGVTAMAFSPFDSNARPSALIKPADGRETPARAPNRSRVALAFSTALLTIGLGAIVVGYGLNERDSKEVAEGSEERLRPAPAQEEQSAEPPAPISPRMKAERPGDRLQPEIPAPGVIEDKPPQHPPYGSDLAFPKLSVEARLIGLLGETAEPSNRIVWFDLDRVQFSSGDAAPTLQSREQLHNIARILAAYPKARTVIIGYPDDTRDTRASRTLGRMRAETVKRELEKTGIAAARLEAKGSSRRASDRRTGGTLANTAISLGIIRAPKSSK
jgi:ferrous iron transport protein B